MTLEQAVERIKSNPNFKTALGNLETHLHIQELEGSAISVLSYYNQPILYQVSKSQLTGDWKPLSDLEDDYLLLFPCVEVFCPSFNAPNSMFIDVYRYCSFLSNCQFAQLPDNYVEYKPVSIRCSPIRR